MTKKILMLFICLSCVLVSACGNNYDNASDKIKNAKVYDTKKSDVKESNAKGTNTKESDVKVSDAKGSIIVNNALKSDKGRKYNPVTIENIIVENYFVTGKNVETFYEIPQRVLVIGANETELLLDLGLEKNILFVIDSQNNEVFPIKQSNMEAWKSTPRMDGRKITKENVLMWKPDLIIAEQYFFSNRYLGSTDYWNKKGIKTMVPLNTTSPSKNGPAESVEKELKFIMDIGRIFKKEDKAEMIVNDIKRRISFINKKTEDLPKPKVMVVDILSVMASYGGDKIGGNIAKLIGADVPATSAVINNEIMMKENPDIVFIVFYGNENLIKGRIDLLMNNKAFRNLNFVKNKKVYVIPLKYVFGPATRIMDSVAYVAERIYPGIFSFEKEYNANK